MGSLSNHLAGALRYQQRRRKRGERSAEVSSNGKAQRTLGQQEKDCAAASVYMRQQKRQSRNGARTKPHACPT